jgi:MscS family membrane protein
VFAVLLGVVTRIISDYALTALGRHYWQRASLLVLLVSVAWLLIRLSNLFDSYATHRLKVQMQVEQITFVGLLTRLFNILVGIVLTMVLLSLAGVNVSALVAGLGIGGIALALAAQKTLADLFGGISVVMRGAVRVGDFCNVAGRLGTVEEIGVSSLRLRTQDRSVVPIPNAKVAEVELENFSLRDQFWLHQVFTVRFDTPSSALEAILEKIVTLLKAHANIDATTARARLIQLTPSGPQIEIFAYYRRPGSDFAQFLGEQEQIILAVMHVIEEAGTSMSAPIGVVRLGLADTPAAPDKETPRSSVDRGDDGI